MEFKEITNPEDNKDYLFYIKSWDSSLYWDVGYLYMTQSGIRFIHFDESTMEYDEQEITKVFELPDMGI